MNNINHPMDDYQDHFEDMLPDEQQLRKELAAQKRLTKRLQIDHELEVARYRLQIQELFAKNCDLTEANHIFAKGLENLRKDQKIVTTTHTHHVIDKESIRKHVDELTKTPQFGPDLKRRVVSILVTRTNAHGQASEVIIITEHIEKQRKTVIE